MAMGTMLEPNQSLIAGPVDVVEPLRVLWQREDVFFRRHHQAREAKLGEFADGAELAAVDAIEFLDLRAEDPNGGIDGSFVPLDAVDEGLVVMDEKSVGDQSLDFLGAIRVTSGQGGSAGADADSMEDDVADSFFPEGFHKGEDIFLFFVSAAGIRSFA